MGSSHSAYRVKNESKRYILRQFVSIKNSIVLLTCFSLFIGIVLTIWGLTHLQWPQALPWLNLDAFIRYIGLIFVSAVLVFVGTWWSKKSSFFIGLVVAFIYALLAGAVWPLLTTLWFAVASSQLGLLVLRGLFIRSNNVSWLTMFLVGVGLYGAVIGLIAHFPVNYAGVYGILLILPLLLNWRGALGQLNSLFVCMNNNYSKLSINKLDVAITVISLVYFVVALMPELGFDSLSMHLFVPTHLALRHQWGFDATTYVWAVMPMLGDWIFSIGYILAGETAARLVNVGFIFILSWLIRDLVLWAGGSVVGARWAVLVFLSTPLTFMEGSSLFIESVWASFVVAGTLAILNACSRHNKPKLDLPVAGLLLGYALAAKAVTFTLLPVLLLLLVIRFRIWFKAIHIPLLTISLCLFFVVGLIPYITAWHLTGNPVFPFFNHVFHSIYYPSDANFNSGFNQGIQWDFLYAITFNSGKYLEAIAGVSGFQWLLLFLPISIIICVAGHRRVFSLLIIGIIWIICVFQSTSYLRYVFPSWVVLTAVIGVILDILSSKGVNKNLSYFMLTLVVGLNLLFLTAGVVYLYGDFAFNSIFDSTNRSQYLEKRLPIRSAVELVNRLNINRTPVAVFANSQTAGISGDALHPSWYNIAFYREIASIHGKQDLVDILLKRGVNYIILDSAWNGIEAKNQKYIKNISSKIAEHGSLSVRKIKIDYHLKSELLSNPDFTSLDGWTLASGAQYDSANGIVLVNVNSPAIQTVSVSPGGRYLNEVVARCAQELTEGRIQINWLDIKGQFVSTNIKTFKCSSIFTKYMMKGTVPPDAVSAVVYVAAHSLIPLAYKRNSLKQ